MCTDFSEHGYGSRERTIRLKTIDIWPINDRASNAKVKICKVSRSLERRETLPSHCAGTLANVSLISAAVARSNEEPPSMTVNVWTLPSRGTLMHPSASV